MLISALRIVSRSGRFAAGQRAAADTEQEGGCASLLFGALEEGKFFVPAGNQTKLPSFSSP